jgi:hypothetical protein
MSEVFVIAMLVIVVGAGWLAEIERQRQAVASAVGTSFTARGPAGAGSAIDHMEGQVRHDISSAYFDHTKDTDG